MRHYYRVTALCRLLNISKRTLHHYDEIGLLKPSERSPSGGRLYSDDDVVRLKKIMSLKFMGFSLESIFVLTKNPGDPQPVLLKSQQAALFEKLEQIKNSAKILAHLTHQVETGQLPQWETMHHLTSVLEEVREDWQKKYYSAEEYAALEKMQQGRTDSYWKKYQQRWHQLFEEIEKQLHTDPHSETGQRLAQELLALSEEAYAGMSPEIRQKAWEAYQAGLVPEEQMPHNRKSIEYIYEAIRVFKLAKAEAVG